MEVHTTRTYERGPVGLTLWSWPATRAFSLRIWRYVLEYYPLVGKRIGRFHWRRWV